jgi:hypothetical protein
MRRVLRVSLLLGVIALTAGSIDPDEFECEEAVEHLKECCGETPVIHCGEGCEKVDLDRHTAQCLRNSTCDEIRAADVCADPKAVACE